MTWTMLSRMLHHPMYAGAYSYGRRRVDRKRTAGAGGRVRMQAVSMPEWKVLKHDRFSAYITWEKYLSNQRRLEQNRSLPDALGTPRSGSALLPGLLICGTCGRRMYASYRTKAKPYYDCMRKKREGSDCCGLGAAALDDLVGHQVLRALEPASLELSLHAIRSVTQERERLHRHWLQRLERAQQEVQRAKRQYQGVEPENRLVLRSLEQRWEQSLQAQQAEQEEYDRFLQEQPRQLQADEQARIVALAADIPTLWHSSLTTHADRKEIVRRLVERVLVQVRADSERTEVQIFWRGGPPTRHDLDRSVSRYESLQNYPQMLASIQSLRKQGRTIEEVAEELNKEGFRTPRSRKGYTSTSVRQLLSRLGRKVPERQQKNRSK
jgi:Recombinase zinc beta ribbon domain/Recombinase